MTKDTDNNSVEWLVVFDLDGTLWQGRLAALDPKSHQCDDLDFITSVLHPFTGAGPALQALSNLSNVHIGISSYNIDPALGTLVLETLGWLKYFDPDLICISGPDKSIHVRDMVEHMKNTLPEERRDHLKVIFIDDKYYFRMQVKDSNSHVDVTLVDSPGYYDPTNKHFHEVLSIVGTGAPEG